MAASPLVTPADLADYQGGDVLYLIAAATALVRRYCGWHVAPLLAETASLTGSGGRVQVLPTLRLTGVASVQNGEFVYTGADYTWSPAGVLTRTPCSGVWVAGEPVVVTMTHGFDAAEDLAAVVAGIVSRAQASPDGSVREQAGPFSRTFSQTADAVAGGVSLVASDRVVLDAYRLPALA